MRRWIMLPLALVLAGTGSAVVPLAASAATPAAAVTTCPTGWGSLPKAASGTGGQHALTGIRTGQQPCFDRMVLDIPGASSSALVGYHVQYVTTLYQRRQLTGSTYRCSRVCSPIERATNPLSWTVEIVRQLQGRAWTATVHSIPITKVVGGRGVGGLKVLDV